MNIVFETVSRGQLPEIREFLIRAFQAAPGSIFEHPGYLEWKYFDERPDWMGPRSFVLRNDGEIIAHCSNCPIAFFTTRGRITAQHSLDWASTVPSGGIMIWRRMYELSDVFIGIDGSTAAQRVLAGLRNFRRIGEQDYFVRVIRPLRFSRERFASGGWKEIMRAGRNFARLAEPWAAVPSGWSLTPVDKVGPEVDQLVAESRFGSFIAPERSSSLLNYLLACPIGNMRAWILRDHGRLRGWAMVNVLGQEARIVDLWLDSEIQTDWEGLIALASRTAGADVALVSVTAVAPFLKAAASANHLRVASSGPVCLHDPKKLLDSAPPINFHAVDGDQAYA